MRNERDKRSEDDREEERARSERPDQEDSGALDIVRFPLLVIRLLLFAFQLMLAWGRACLSADEAEREFGRKSLVHCAEILERRKHDILAPGSFTATWVARAAANAAHYAVKRCDDWEQATAASWLDWICELVDVDTESVSTLPLTPDESALIAEDEGIEGDDHGPRFEGRRDEEVRDDPTPMPEVFSPIEERGTDLGRDAIIRAAQASEPPTIQPDEDLETVGFSFSDDEEQVDETEVFEHLAQERALNSPENAPTAFRVPD